MGISRTGKKYTLTSINNTMGFSIENDYEESSRISPFLVPGSYNVRLVNISLDRVKWDKNESLNDRFINFIVEGSEILEGDFKGWAIDPNRPELGNYGGQIAFINSGEWAFKDFTTRTGKFISRDNQIGNWVCNFARCIGKFEDLKEKVKDNSDIEEWIKDVNDLLSGSIIAVTFGGAEYKNSKGYPAFRMYFPKPEGMLQPFANAAYSSEVMAKCFLKFHQKFNLPIYVKKETPVTSFAGTAEPVSFDSRPADLQMNIPAPLNMGQVNF